MTKSPSPQNSSAPTTGTTTTPTSLDNVSSSEGKGPAPEFPTDTLTPAQRPPAGDASWGVSSVSMYGDPASPSYQTPPSHDTGSPMEGRYNPSQYPAALKMLVSNNVAGSIIGRAGQTISELQSQSHTRIKLSQSGDYYPGTQDRVCLVQGEPENVKLALRLLLERFYMLQEHQHSQHMAWQLQKQKGGAVPAFDFVVRLLVPTSSCGMIIGKAGSNIKFMEESTGVSAVRLSPKDSTEVGFPTASIMAATSERIVTVTGSSLDCCVHCLYLIVDGMVAHPDICRYTNMTTSYSRIMSDTYVASPSNQPVLVSVPSPQHSSPEQHLWDSFHGVGPYNALGLTRRIASSPDLTSIMLSHRQGMGEAQTPDRMLRYSGIGSPAPYPSPVQMPGTAAGAPSMGLPMYLIPHQSQVGDHNFGSMPSDVGQLDGRPGGVHHSVSAPDLLAFQLDQSMRLSTAPIPPPPIPLHPHPQHSPSHAPPMASPSSDFTDTFLPQAPTMTGPGSFTAQVPIPDNMIGSILGRGGRTLTELQMLSGTRIRISQRGDFMPGTRSRVVTIRGPTAQTVWQAQYMISQRMVLPPTAVGPPPGPPSLYPRNTIPPHATLDSSATGYPTEALMPPGLASAPPHLQHGASPGAVETGSVPSLSTTGTSTTRSGEEPFAGSAEVVHQPK